MWWITVNAKEEGRRSATAFWTIWGNLVSQALAKKWTIILKKAATFPCHWWHFLANSNNHAGQKYEITAANVKAETEREKKDIPKMPTMTLHEAHAKVGQCDKRKSNQNSKSNGMENNYCTFDLKYLVGHRKNINGILMRSKTPSLSEKKRICAWKFVCSSNIGRVASFQNT